jgi:uncharacterized phage protein gp47/JayE
VSEQQTFIDDPTRKMLGADILVKEAVTTLVDVIFKIVLTNGFTNNVKNVAQTAVTQYIAGLNIGQALEQSDVIRIITEVDGVDRVDLPLIKFDRATETGQLNIVTAAANEILAPGIVEAQL